jgi:hypothetical protein
MIETGKDFRKWENGGGDDYEWSGNQLDQEEWWIGDFEFSPTQIITINWYSSKYHKIRTSL